MSTEHQISFAGIDPATLIFALYRGTRALGMGVLHDKGDLTLDEVKVDFAEKLSGKSVHIDYYRGRPLKVFLNLEEKNFDSRLYDRDAGRGAAAEVVESLRGAA